MKNKLDPKWLNDKIQDCYNDLRVLYKINNPSETTKLEIAKTNSRLSAYKEVKLKLEI